MSFQTEAHFRMLLSRLVWPSPLVQERACRALATLLRDESQRDDAWHHLRRWMQTRTIEMDSVAGLLVLARVTIEEGGLPVLFPGRPAPQSASPSPASSLPPITEVIESLSRPSLLSWLLLRDTYRRPDLPLEEGSTQSLRLHSGSPPDDFEPSFYFLRYCTQYVPGVFNYLAEEIDKNGLHFKRQWSFEWQQMSEQAGIEKNSTSLHFWLGGDQGKEYHTAALPRMGQVFRSAFLRTLAWAYENKILGAGDVFGMTAKMRPVDLELWAIEPTSRPIWWPRAEEEVIKALPDEPEAQSALLSSRRPAELQPLNRAPTDIWQQVEHLWNRSAHFQSCGNLLEGKDFNPNSSWQLMAAQGPVIQGDSFYFLEIVGFFQRCVGHKVPDADAIAQWLAGGTKAEHFAHTQEPLTHATGFQVWGGNGSPLRYCGNIKPEDGEGKRFGGWEMLAGARQLQGWAQMSWQFWRQRPCFWLPAPCLLPQPTGQNRITFGCESLETTGTSLKKGDMNCLIVRVGDTELGNWLDWTDGLRETTVGDLPSLTGQRLLVPRAIIEDFEKESESTFCWLCRITGYVRNSGYDIFKTWSESRVLGASLLMRPTAASLVENLDEFSLDPVQLQELIRRMSRRQSD